MTRPSRLCVYRHAKGDSPAMCMFLDSREMPPGTFHREEPCRVLLSMRHVRALGINLNAHAKRLKHIDVQYLPWGHRDNAATYARTCRVTEQVVATFLEQRGGTAKEPKRCSVEDVQVGSDLTSAQVQRIRDINREYSTVFALSPDDLPPLMKDVEPHQFRMRPEAKPRYCRRPKWGPCTTRYLTEWRNWALEQGLIEPAPTTAWASRVVIAAKYRGDTPKTAPPDGLRVCCALVSANEEMVKCVPTYTDP